MADNLIEDDDIIRVAEFVRNGCPTECAFLTFAVEHVELPTDIEIGDRAAYHIRDSRDCGSAGCRTAILAIGPSDVHILADGLGRTSIQSTSLRSVSNQTLISVSSPVDSGSANRLFVEAVQWYQAAIRADDHSERLKLFGDVREHITRIVQEYPESLPARLIISGENLGGLDRHFVGRIQIVADIQAEQRDISSTRISIAADLLLDYADDLDRIDAVADAAEFMVLASAAYDGGLELMQRNGWWVVRRFDIAPEGGAPVGNLVATLFGSDDGRYVLAYRGTEDDFGDNVTNLSTIINSDFWNQQVAEARNLAQLVAAENPEIVFAGHSLGGRFAQVARLETDRPAYIFNSARLGDNDLEVAASQGTLNVSAPLNSFRAPEDFVTEFMDLDGVEVSNIEQVDLPNMPDLVIDSVRELAHGRATLTQAMVEVQTARDGGWIEAALESRAETRPNPGETVATHADAAPQGGPLCSSARSSMLDSDLSALLWRSRISGYNAEGASWDEYLGADYHTIFVNSEGREFAGFYTIQNNQVCFSYGTSAHWNCKNISRCLSGEGDYVISDLQGNQTSVITEVEPYGFAPYFAARWGGLERSQQLVRPGHQQSADTRPIEPGPVESDRTYTSLPENAVGQIGPVINGLAAGNRSAFVNRQTCTIVVTESVPIVEQITSGNGMAFFLGAVDSNGRTEVGERTIATTIPLESVERIVPLGRQILFQVSQGATIEVEDVWRYEDGRQSRRPSVTSQRTVAFRLSGVSGLDTLIASAQALSDHCAGREALVPQAVPAIDTSISAVATPEDCARIANQTTRLECFDAAFSAQVQPQTARENLRVVAAPVILQQLQLEDINRVMRYSTGGFEAAVQQGIVAPALYHLGPGPTGNPWEAMPTSLGRERGIEAATPSNFTLANPILLDVIISGTAMLNGDPNVVAVEFEWRIDPTNLLIQRIGRQGGAGEVQLRRWDDGWRVEESNVYHNKPAMPASIEARTQAENDASTTRLNGGPWYFVQSEGTFMPASQLQ